MPFYARWKLGTPLLISSLSGVTGVIVSVCSLVLIALSHVERGLRGEHIAVIGLFGSVALLTVIAGLFHELRMGLRLATGVGSHHLIDYSPEEHGAEIERCLRGNIRQYTRGISRMKALRALLHLLLFVAFMIAWWSHGGMFHNLRGEMKWWEVIALGVCWFLYLPHAFMPMVLHRQLAHCGLCAWPTLPRWMIG